VSGDGVPAVTVDPALVGVFLSDADGVLTVVDPAGARLLGYAPEELVGKTFESLLAPEDVERLKSARAHVQAHGVKVFEGELHRKDGSILAGEVTTTALADGRWQRIVRDVTDRVATKHLLDAAPDALVVVDRQGLITYVNAQTEHLFGFAKAELLGQPLHTLIPQRLRANHAGHVHRYFGNPKARPMGSGLELVGLTRSGAELPIEVSLSPYAGVGSVGVCAAIRDISERKRLEAGVRINADRLSSTIESVEDAIALYDGSDKLVLCNSAYRKLLGLTVSGPMVGKPYSEILDGFILGVGLAADIDPKSYRAERLSTRAQQRNAYTLRTRDGRSLRVMNRRTVEGGVVQTIWDLTEEMEREQELHKARQAAETASAAKSEFLASMSHELRTPLNAILGFAQLLHRDKKAPLPDRHKDRIEHILKGGEHLLKLIDEVLDLSRIESGRVTVSPEAVSVPEVIEEVEATLSPMAARAEARLELVLPPKTSLPRIHADRTRFRQILLNYGSNAIKYGRSGGRVSFVVTALDGHVRVAVKDDGFGIAKEKQEKLFQPFHRAGQETGTIEGTGIGLAITKRLAELMHGKVGFTSAEGQGSEFWVDLPAHLEAPREAQPPPSPRPDSALLANASGARALLVYIEDNPSNIAFMMDLLADFDGVELVTAPTAEIGVEIVRARKPAAVIMDINLPGMSGFDATRLLHSWEETKAIPIIALSAAAMVGDGGRVREAGFHRYLTKPVQVDELTRVLEELFERS
jgi:PAS domain S-box-containing protein